MDADQVAALRAHYADIGLDEADLAPDPISYFRRWLDEVVSLGVPEPNAMVLSTTTGGGANKGADEGADAEGQPSSRHVLLKAVDDDGFVFFTNYGSRKAHELAENPRASLCFPWFCIGRQVIVVGSATKVSREQTDDYFQSRPRESQLGTWASAHQSDVLADRAELDRAFAEVSARFADDAVVPTPPFWGGYRVSPITVEFWQGRTARLHDRLRYRRPDEGGDDAHGGWIIERLSP